MIKKIPVAASPITIRNLRGVFCPKDSAKEDFEAKLKAFLNSKNIFLTNSGITAFYIILESLKKLSSGKKEVILPAYTAPALVIAVRKSGLKPVLVDISSEDFNINTDLLESVTSENTLCIVIAHMFGIPVAKTDVLKDKFKDTFIIEDCAQSMGAKIDERALGTFGDCGFFSFNRGKNLPTYGGGAVATSSQTISGVLNNIIDGIKDISVFTNFFVPLKILLFSLAIKPTLYGGLYPLISLFKSTAVPKDFQPRRYSKCQASVALSILEDFDRLVDSRHNNGTAIIRGLQNVKGLIVPVIRKNIKPAFNRLPVVFKELSVRKKAEKLLQNSGIETSYMYERPIHHVFDLGYEKDDFPNATYFARHLLTLPVHPLLTDKDISKIVDIVKQAN